MCYWKIFQSHISGKFELARNQMDLLCTIRLAKFADMQVSLWYWLSLNFEVVATWKPKHRHPWSLLMAITSFAPSWWCHEIWQAYHQMSIASLCTIEEPPLQALSCNCQIGVEASARSRNRQEWEILQGIEILDSLEDQTRLQVRERRRPSLHACTCTALLWRVARVTARYLDWLYLAMIALS